jgi:hypothetical protein
MNQYWYLPITLILQIICLESEDKGCLGVCKGGGGLHMNLEDFMPRSCIITKIKFLKGTFLLGHPI